MLQAHPGTFLFQTAVSIAIAFFWLAISAAILRTACALFNRMAQGDSVEKAVAEPTFGWALIIQLLGGVLSFAAYFGVTVVIRRMEGDLPIPAPLLPFAQAGVSLAISLVVFTLVYTLSLPTTLPRAFVVCILVVLLTVVLALLLAALIALPWFLLSRG